MELKSVIQNYDLVFVGGGISCTHTLLSLLDGLESKNPIKPLSILVIEKSPNFWTGIAFGPRSSKKALSITTLDEFIHPGEKAEFLTWLRANILVTILNFYKEDSSNQDWIESNREKLENNQLENLYFPRYLYGKYLEEKLKLKFTVLKNQGKVQLTLHQAEVINIYKVGESYSISLKNAAGIVSAVMAQKLILSMGHQGRKSILPNTSSAGKNFVPDPYFPSMDQNIKDLKIKLDKPDLHPKNVLIVGSNASALELLYILKSDQEILDKIDKIVVLSPSGTLPFPIHENLEVSYDFPILEIILESGNYSAETVMKGIYQEIEGIKKAHISLGDVYYPFGEKVISLLKGLTHEERRIFHDLYGMEFTRIIRRAGSDYSKTIAVLKRKKKFEILKGKIADIKKTQVEKTREDQYILYYQKKNTPINYPETFISIFNCSGFEVLSESDNPLIQNLIHKNICRVNPSNRGFEVNDQLEGNQNLFIIGPLLGSLFIPSYQYWHVENSKRIYELSRKLANHILERIPSYREKELMIEN